MCDVVQSVSILLVALDKVKVCTDREEHASMSLFFTGYLSILNNKQQLS